eukprot:11089-Pelagomonas_calceolata.AAC.1
MHTHTCSTKATDLMHTSESSYRDFASGSHHTGEPQPHHRCDLTLHERSEGLNPAKCSLAWMPRLMRAIAIWLQMHPLKLYVTDPGCVLAHARTCPALIIIDCKGRGHRCSQAMSLTLHLEECALICITCADGNSPFLIPTLQSAAVGQPAGSQ